MKTKKIKIPLYGISFTAIIFENDTEFSNKFKNCEFEPRIEDFDGGVFEIDDHLYVALRAYQKGKIKYPTPGIIAHEAKHLVNRVYQYVGQELDLYNDEAECYLLGWIVNRLHELI